MTTTTYRPHRVRTGAATYETVNFDPAVTASVDGTYRSGALLLAADDAGRVWLLAPPSGAAHHDLDGSLYGVPLDALEHVLDPADFALLFSGYLSQRREA
ncbi:MAG: hypothetical protein GC157_01140 [Frankiales bacterium]|nr:hypothetical protein [Frankiales bacterium]